MRSTLWLVLGLSVSSGSVACAPVPGAPGGGGDYSGTYCGTARTVTPGGTTSGAVTFSCSGGSCADPGNTFTGTVSASGFFTGSTRVCGACAAFPMSGQMSTSGAFTISGSSGGGSSQTVTASYCGGPSGGGGGGDTIPPGPPTDLEAVPSSISSCYLSWLAPPDGDVAGYEVHREGRVSPIATVTSGTSASDTGLQMATRYCYTVVAYDAAGNRSAPSAQACATTPCETTPPSTPQQLSAFGRAESEIRVTWARSTDEAPGTVAGYRLYRNGALAADVRETASEPSAIDAGLATLARHCYEVEAYDGCGNVSARSAPACGATIGILVSDAPAPERIAIDASRVYWTDGGTSKLMSVSRSDGTVAELAASLLGNALETDGTSVFYVGWNDAHGLELRAVPAGGGPPRTIAAGVGASDLAVDATTVFAAGGALVHVAIGGGSPSYLPAAPYRLALDESHVYWTEHDAGAVRMAPLGGTEVTTLASGRYGPYAIAVDATHVYWTEDGSGGGSASIRKRRKDLSEPMTTLVTRPNAGPFGMAVDATDVYWGEYTGGGVYAIGKDGTSFRRLVERAYGPSDLVADETGIYWVERGAHVVARALK